MKMKAFVLQCFPMIQTKMSMKVLVWPVRDHPLKLKIEKN